MMTFPPIIRKGDARLFYREWPAPTVIISDGVYESPGGLIEWYEPHIEEWSACAQPNTSLWLWCSEIGWATLHPILSEYDWTFQGCNVWDKGVIHAMLNGGPPNAFPSSTELCVHYVRDPDKAVFKHPTNVTNVWRESTVRGTERVARTKIQQKPLRLMNLILQAASEPGDVVWEPFGGTCSAGIAAFQTGRVSFCAETDADTFQVAVDRINAMSELESARKRQIELFDLSQADSSTPPSSDE